MRVCCILFSCLFSAAICASLVHQPDNKESHLKERDPLLLPGSKYSENVDFLTGKSDFKKNGNSNRHFLMLINCYFLYMQIVPTQLTIIRMVVSFHRPITPQIIQIIFSAHTSSISGLHQRNLSF